MAIKIPGRRCRHPKSRQAQCEQTGARLARLSSGAATMWRPLTIV